jgi:hypothetical protein
METNPDYKMMSSLEYRMMDEAKNPVIPIFTRLQHRQKVSEPHIGFLITTHHKEKSLLQ